MKVLVAGATGALGKQLVPRLVADGHEVVGTTRTESKLEAICASSAPPASSSTCSTPIRWRAWSRRPSPR